MKSPGSPHGFMVKAFGYRLAMMGYAGIVLAVSSAADASLIPTVFIDTPTELAIVWDWDEFGAGGGQVADLDFPPLVNWDVVLTTTPAGVIPTWTVDIDVFHVTDPHVGDAGGGNLANLTKVFDDDQFLGSPVLPDVFSGADHPAVGHFDLYEMQVFHSATGALNLVKLFGEHIPEPGTLSLLAFGGLLLTQRRRRLQIRRRV